MKEKPEDYLSETAVESAKDLRIQFYEDKEKYSKRQYAYIYKGYDFLENLLSVRTYIQKRYEIDFPTLELLLKLMGMKIFTRKDFAATPREFSHQRFRTVLDSGLIVVLADHDDVERRLFTLSVKSKNIVVKFYQYLSGEKKIPEDYANNPLNNKNRRVTFDKKKMDVIKLMNQLPPKPHNKTLF